MITFRDDFKLWPTLEAQLTPRLPLRNLTWKSLRGVRTIPYLNLKLQPFDPSLLPKSAILASLTPAIHLYFVTCDDIETYKQVIRSEIKDWVSNFTGANAKRTADQDWAILYINTNAHPGNTGSGMGASNNSTGNMAKFASQTQKFLSMKSTVLDKIKSDFGSIPPISPPLSNTTPSSTDETSPPRRLDRVISLRIHAGDFTKDHDAWSDFFARIKNGIITSFEAQVGRYDDDIARLDAQRLIPGWNFCQFFLLKEGLANCFAATSLLDDALVLLDELEATFEQTVHQQVIGFTEFVSLPTDTQVGLDDVGPMMLLNRECSKDFRSLLLNNAISVFDFRIYLAYRQFVLLIQIKNPLELSKRVTRWLRGFLPQVHAHSTNLPAQFAESLTISVVESALEAIDIMIPHLKSDASEMVLIQNAKLDLILYGKAALDRIGVLFYNMTASLARFSIIDPSVPQEPTEHIASFKLSTPSFVNALKSLADFALIYKRYLDAGEVTAHLAQRPRFSMLVQTDRANLEYTLGHWAEAGNLYSKVIAGYANDGWLRIDQCLLHRQAQCYRQVGARNEYLMTCLRLIASNIVNDSVPTSPTHDMSVSLSSSSSTSHTLDQHSLIDWRQLIDVARELDNPVLVDFTPLFEVRLPSHLFTLNNPTQFKSITALSLDTQSPVVIISHLASVLIVDRISLVLVGGESGDLVFSTRSSLSAFSMSTETPVHIELVPGESGTPIAMTWDSPGPAGEYVVEKVEIEVGKLVFVTNLIKENRKHTIRIIEPPSPIKLSIGLPPVIHTLNSGFVVSIDSQNPLVAGGVLALWSLRPSFSALACESAVLIDKVSGSVLESLDRASGEHLGRYLLPQISLDNNSACVLVTLTEPWKQLEVKALMECVVSFQDTDVVDKIPLAISHIDSVTNADVPLVTVDLQTISGSHHYLALTIRNMNEREILCIDKCNVKQSDLLLYPVVDNLVTIPPNRSALIAFRMPDPGSESTFIGTVLVHHHFIDEDARAYLMTSLEQMLASKDLSQYYPLLHRFWSLHLSTQSWTQLILTGITDISNPGPVSLGVLPRNIGTALTNATEEFYESVRSIKLADVLRSTSENRAPRQLRVPVEIELPIAHLLHGIRLVGHNGAMPKIGTPWPCEIVVKRVSTSRLNSDVLNLVFHVLASDDAWLIVGSRRKGFQLEVDANIEFSIFLIPLVSGDIPLPELSLAVETGENCAKAPVVSLELLSGTEFPQSVLVQPEASTTLVINGTNVHKIGHYPAFPQSVPESKRIPESPRGRSIEKSLMDVPPMISQFQPSSRTKLLHSIISGSQSLIGFRRNSEFSIAS